MHTSEEVHKVSRVPSPEAYCAHGVGVRVSPSWSRDMLTNRKLSEPCTLGIFMETSSWQHDGSLSHFPAPFSSLENGRQGWKCQASNHGLVFWWLIPIPDPSRSHLLRTKGASLTQKITRVFRSSVSRTKVKDKMVEPGAETHTHTHVHGNSWVSICWMNKKIVHPDPKEVFPCSYGTLFFFEVKDVVAQSCLTLCDAMDYSPPDSSAHGVLQAIILEWVTIPFSRGFSNPGIELSSPAAAGRFFNSDSLSHQGNLFF